MSMDTDVKFEIRGNLTKAHYVDLYKHVIRHRIFMSVFMAMVGVVALVDGIWERNTAWLIVAVLDFAYAVFVFARPWLLAAKAIKKHQEKGPGVTAFSHVIQDTENGSVMVWPYARVKELYITQRLIALFDGEGFLLIMDRNSFTVGSFEDFLPFIQEKCPQAKRIIQ